jgi:hypothetical protein
MVGAWLLAGASLGASACASHPAAARATGTASPADRGVAARDVALLDTLAERTFRWFWDTTDSTTGLTPDRWPRRTFSSVAAIGFALTAYRAWVDYARTGGRTHPHHIAVPLDPAAGERGARRGWA